MIVSVHKAKGLGAVGYSTPGAPISMSDGRFYVTFFNPNGTTSTWFSNFAPGSVPYDNNFVNPPDSVWQSIGVQGTAQQANLTAALAQQAVVAASAGPVISYTQAMANQTAQQAAAVVTPVKTTNTSGGGNQVASFSFTSSGGNASQLQVGDVWTIKITGATPNSAVTVNGTKNGSSFGVVAEGATDGGGNYSSSMAVGSGDVGTWQEVWSVGTTNVGGIMFSVVPRTTSPPSQAPAGSIVPPTSGGGGTNSVNTPTSASVFDLFGDTSAPISIGSFQMGEYTAIGLAAALVVGFMMMSHKR